MSSATVLGFGGQTPPNVLEALSKAVTDCGIEIINPKRSQNFSLALNKHPYRIFLKNEPAKEDKNPKNLLLYCLPTTATEYIQFSSEACGVRSAILSGDSETVVAAYDPKTSEFVGGTTGTVLLALTGDQTAQSSLASSTLESLSQLDIMAAKHCKPLSERDVVIVVGSGGREHALAVALARSPLVGKVVCCPGNGGTATEGGKVSNALNVGGKQDTETVTALVKQTGATLVVVGPEAPLVAGLVDDLKQTCPDVRVFGPSKDASELEASKAFTKDFLLEHEIPTAKYKNFTDASEAIAYVESLGENDRQVVKASGLAAGKGVLIPTTKAETVEAIKEIMTDKAFGAAGDTCVVESFLTGPEASCLAFCDGKSAVLMPAAQDHKRALDNDQGLNTGGMGAYAPAPCVTPTLQKEIEAMCIKTVQKMAERGTPYVGVLYAGMMLTPDGPKVLEFNCRFGDPETQVLLPLLETDLYEVMIACCEGRLEDIDVRFKENTSAATIVCAAKGYPEKYPKGMEITGITAADKQSGVKVYHAGTKVDDEGVTRCSGGRVLAVTGIGSDLQAALRSAYSGAGTIDFVGPNKESLLHKRTDIARRAVERKLRLGVLGSTRGTASIPVIEACKSESLHAEIAAVVSNRESAPILDKGRALGATVTTKFLSAKGLTRAQYDAQCSAVLVEAGVDFVLLVGYMRILSKEFTDFWAGKCINVHPSLLPKHAGGMDLAVHQAVLDAGEEETGCTIHQVTEAVDGGPIVIQKKVKVDPGETAESLKAKVQAQEGKAFIEAIEMHIKGDVDTGMDIDAGNEVKPACKATKRPCSDADLDGVGGPAADQKRAKVDPGEATKSGVISYADAGVNIDAGNKVVDLIKPACKATKRPGCEADLGGFGGLFDLAAAGYNSADTVLIGATDGVGTKLRIAQAVKKHETVGIDLVAMCVNDLIVAGGEPLFFLDYYATGHLHVDEAAAVVRGIAEGCKQAECGLIGGETAEMPSMYAPGDYDLAGFSVGAVHRDRILPKGVAVGDVLLGLSSSGIHSNGFSLVRKLVEKEGLTYASACPWDDSSSKTIGDSLLTPTRIYVKSCLALIKKGLVKGLAHITGGGLIENLPRCLPEGVGAKITSHPALSGVFQWLRQASGLGDDEMLRTFNCGIGMVLIIAESDVTASKEVLRECGEEVVYDLGILEDGQGVKVEHALA